MGADSGDVRWSIAVGGDSTEAALMAAVSPADGGKAGRRAVLVLAHGAGSHMDHASTLAIAEVFRGLGLDVVRFNFLYRALGKGRPDPMPRLIECFGTVVQRVRDQLGPRALLIGGRSMGGRAATMMAADGFPCDGVVPVAYPLHPPGRTDRLRDEHLRRIKVPVQFLCGTRDDLCRRDLMDRVVEGLPGHFSLHWIEGADHSFRVLKRSGRTEQDVLEEVAGVARTWIDCHIPE